MGGSSLFQREEGDKVDIIAELTESGFDRVMALDGAECGEPALATILLAFRCYRAEGAAVSGAWIHPYYFASQQAYEAAADIARRHAADGAALRDDIRLKPIFARLPELSQGRNTLSYLDGAGSRFHVQTLTLTQHIPPTHHLLAADKPLHCGDCHRCEAACPTGALEGGVFHRERCLRNWQMSGKPVPEELRAHMGTMLIGCDICQRVCPHNAPAAPGAQGLPLAPLLTSPKESALALRPRIGVNLTIPNRVLGQSCLLAGCSGDESLLPALEQLCTHPSPVVAEHAAWAVSKLKKEESTWN